MSANEKISEIKARIVKAVENYNITEGFIDCVNDSKPCIFKRVLTGYAAIKVSTGQRNPCIFTRPIFLGSDSDEDVDCGAIVFEQYKEQLINVIPCSRYIVGVWITLPEKETRLSDIELDTNFDLDQNPKFLGYEIEGQPHEDWLKLARQLWVDRIFESETVGGFKPC
jgi:hypothetical protein